LKFPMALQRSIIVVSLSLAFVTCIISLYHSCIIFFFWGGGGHSNCFVICILVLIIPQQSHR
jgi:hypothetical protein